MTFTEYMDYLLPLLAIDVDFFCSTFSAVLDIVNLFGMKQYLNLVLEFSLINNEVEDSGFFFSKFIYFRERNQASRGKNR